MKQQNALIRLMNAFSITTETMYTYNELYMRINTEEKIAECSVTFRESFFNY